MKFKPGDRVELNYLGVDYYKKTYSNHNDFINNILTIDKKISNGSYSCIFSNSSLFTWIREEYLQLDKKHYRKEKLKQLKNEI